MFYGLLDLAGRGPQGLRSGEFWALNDVSFDLEAGESLAVVGPNGAGKTTLLRMISGIILPDKGRITICGRVGALIAAGAAFHPMLTGRENIYLNAAVMGMGRDEVRAKLDSIIEFAGVGDFLDSPVKFYSSGMAMRLGFSVAAHFDPEILLVDEVLAVGDEGFQKKCLEKLGALKKNGTASVLVSHNMHTVSLFADGVMLLKQGTAQRFTKTQDGIIAYKALFTGGDSAGELICAGNDVIRFAGIGPGFPALSAGDDLVIRLPYESESDFNDVYVNVVLMVPGEQQYYEGSNKTFGKRVDLAAGKHCLTVTMQGLFLSSASLRLSVAVWSSDRTSLLFWERMPVTFKPVPGVSGAHAFPVTFNLQ